MLDRMFMGAAADDKLFVEDVFSTYLYTGNGSSQTITNGIDLAGKGGLVIQKERSSAYTDGWFWADTVRGANNILKSQNTNGQITSANTISAFSSTGFTAGSNISFSGSTYASWTFREAPKFFDIVTYTGNGSSLTLAHTLGVTPGCIIVKRIDTTSDWSVYHRSLSDPNTFNLRLNTAISQFNNGANFISGASSTNFTVNNFAAINASGGTYVAYLFAHDPTADGIIQCGSYTGNGSATGPVVNLGWEPQWLLIKRATASNDFGWVLFDNMRGMPVGSEDAFLSPNLSDPEYSAQLVDPSATGFSPNTTAGDVNASGSTYVYMAIRRGPMRTPTLGTSVFAPLSVTSSTTGSVRSFGFSADMIIGGVTNSNNTASNWFWIDRLRGFTASTDDAAGNAQQRKILSSSTNAETTNTGPTNPYLYNIWNSSALQGTGAGYIGNGANLIYHAFRRAPGFFDEVCYTGNGSTQAVAHNLSAAPELIIVKARTTNFSWTVYSSGIAAGNYMFLNLTNASAGPNTTLWGNNSAAVAPTSTAFTVGNYVGLNQSGVSFVAYLFASAPGVSKVGSYTGNGSSQTINCGFAAGARFVMIKRTDSTGDWYVWDTARGIVAANDPHLSLNTTAAEVTTDDTIDPDSSGFVVNQVAATNVNVNAATYIYLAIA